MKYIRKSLTNVLVAVVGIILFAAIAVWQFYLFATFNNSQSIVGMQGGAHHLWWAIGVGLIACVASFFVFSVFLRYDKDNEIHITS